MRNPLRGRVRKPIALLAAMIALAVALLITGAFLSVRVQALTLSVNAAYEKALFESASLMSGVQLNLEKLLISSDKAQEQVLLTNVARQCEGVQNNLSQMPIGPEILAGTMKFVNQAGDFSRVLSERLSDKEQLSENDLRQLITLHDTCVQLNASLAGTLTQYERGELVFEANPQALSAVRRLSDEKNPMAEYPVLLYDGPFSDASEGTELAVGGEIVDPVGAQHALIRFVGEDRVQSARYIGESNILGKCFEYEIQTREDGLLTGVVTQVGGHVLYMLPDQFNTEVLLSQGECIDMAHEFLRAHGFGDMEVSFWRQLGGILTVNFAASQQGVLLYPDLVKLQISMRDGLVIGVEAGNYLKNHRVRQLIEPPFTSEQALSALSPQLTAERIRQCVIPTDAGEAQCWEITARMSGGNGYLVYLDIETGEELRILKIMVEDDGILAQ